MSSGGKHDALLEADIERICRTLASYGAMTRDGLARHVHAHEWEAGRFRAALAHAVDSGRVVELGEGFYELGETELGI